MLIKRKMMRTVLCCIVYDTCDKHTRLSDELVRFTLSFCVLCRLTCILCVFVACATLFCMTLLCRV